MADTVVPIDDEIASRRRRRRREIRFLGRVANWLGSLIVGLAGLLVVTFAFTHISPVDPVIRVVGDKATQATYDAARHQLGLDLPLPEQFALYVVRVFHGDLGLSWSTGQPVASDLAHAFPATFELATVGIVIGAVLGISPRPYRRAVAGRLARFDRPRGLLLGYSVPIFWLGLCRSCCSTRSSTGSAAPADRTSSTT